MFHKPPIDPPWCECFCLGAGVVQHPNLPTIWLCTEHPHVGLIHPGLIHGRHASQCVGPVVLLALSFTAVKKLAQKSNEPSSADAGLCATTATSFDRHIQNMSFSFATMTSCEQSHDKLHNWHADSSRRSVVQRNRERTTPRDLEPNLSQMLHSF